MRKTILAALAATALLGASVQAATADDWISLAINHHGWGYGTGWSEAQAKLNAFNECRNDTGAQCYAAVSVPYDWYLVGIYCNGQPSVAGSQWSYDRAMNLAAQKLGYNRYSNRDCYVDAEF